MPKRVCAKCMKSNVIKNVPRKANGVLRNSSLQRKYIAGTIKTPASVPAKRQPNGVMPKSAIDQEMNTLPSGGWVFSYHSMLCSCS